jgi:hypothetical protein
MRVFLTTVLAGLLLLGAGPSAANTACTREDLAKAVNDAGAALRKLNAENTPRLQDKMRQLKTKMRWPDAGYEEQAFKALQDERVAAFDAGANDLLARIDRLGTVDAKAEPDCSRLQELQAASIELQATVKAKSSYLLSKIDQMLAGAPGAAPKTAAALAHTPPPEQKPAVKQTPPKTPEPVAPKATAKAPEGSAWSAETKPRPAPSQDTAALSQPLPPIESVDEGYTIDEIRAVSAGLFGQVSTNLASVIEHVFSKSGRPTGYVLGSEGGGAFLAGVRYGKGTLYLRSGGTQPIYWHGPSLCTDVGADGSKTLFLIYRLRNAEQLYDSFTGVDGSAYLVGGVGATLITNGNVVMAPIRSGLGLRLGANIGYIRFTPKPTWNPF